jgi:anti-sigma factor RsiW
MDAREAALELTDYVLGRLDDARREAVAAAVAQDPELQGLEAWLRQVRRLLQLAGGAIFGHPAADRLVTFAVAPETADPQTAAHAVSCPACRDLVAATRATGDDLASQRPSLARWWARLTWRDHGRPLTLGVVAALAMLLVVGPLVQGPTEGPSGATRTLQVPAAVRSAGAEVPVVALDGIATITLLLEIDPYVGAASTDVTASLELRRDGQAAFRWSGPAREVWNPRSGQLSLLVPTTALLPGDYELLLDLDGATALQRTVRLVP